MIHKNLFFFFFLSILFLFSACSKDDPDEETEVKTIQAIIDPLQEEFNSGGLIVAYKKKGENIDYGVFGKSDATTLLTNSVSMGVANNTKTFTATLILKLQEEGKLNLDDKIGDYFSDTLQKNIEATISIRQLLNHSSGINDPTNKFFGKIFTNPSYEYSFDEYVESIGEREFEKGSKNEYSSANYILLGKIIESVTGKTYDEFLREEIVEKLDLSATFLSGKETPTNSVGYSWLSNTSLKDFERGGVESISWSAGSLFSSAKDMVSWYEALFENKFLSDNSLNEMLTFSKEEEQYFGLGIFKRTYKEQKLFVHGGETLA